MSERKLLRETELVVRRVMKAAQKYDRIGKSEFESLLHKLIQQVHNNTGFAIETISGKTDKVLADMPNEYGQFNEADRSLESMFAYLYGKYLKELGEL